MVLVGSGGAGRGVVKHDAKFVRRQKRDQEISAGLADLTNEFGPFGRLFFVRFVVGRFAGGGGRLPFVAELEDRLKVGHAEQLHLLGLADAQVVDELLTQRQQDKLK